MEEKSAQSPRKGQKESRHALKIQRILYNVEYLSRLLPLSLCEKLPTKPPALTVSNSDTEKSCCEIVVQLVYLLHRCWQSDGIALHLMSRVHYVDGRPCLGFAIEELPPNESRPERYRNRRVLTRVQFRSAFSQDLIDQLCYFCQMYKFADKNVSEINDFLMKLQRIKETSVDPSTLINLMEECALFRRFSSFLKIRQCIKLHRLLDDQAWFRRTMKLWNEDIKDLQSAARVSNGTLTLIPSQLSEFVGHLSSKVASICCFYQIHLERDLISDYTSRLQGTLLAESDYGRKKECVLPLFELPAGFSDDKYCQIQALLKMTLRSNNLSKTVLYLELDYAFEFIINTKHRLLPGAFQHFKLMCYELSPYSTIHQIEQCDNNSSVSFIATVYNLPLVPRGLAQNNELFLAIVSSIDKLLITYLKVADMLQRYEQSCNKLVSDRQYDLHRDPSKDFTLQVSEIELKSKVAKHDFQIYSNLQGEFIEKLQKYESSDSELS